MKEMCIPTLIAISIISLIACSTSPLGRNQFTLMPDDQMNSMGIQSFEEMKRKLPIERNSKINSYVNCIVQPIIAESKSKLPSNQWEVVVFQSKDVNAFALPGGKIGVYTGILPILKNDAQLASVMGHEVGHVIARHGNERVSGGLGANAALLIADLLTGKSDPETKQYVMAGLGLGLQFGVLLPFSRTHENEADIIGLQMMAKAGFDPRQSVEVWKNMTAARGGKGPPEFLSTHPSDTTRIQNLQSQFGHVMPLYESAQKAGKRPHCALN